MAGCSMKKKGREGVKKTKKKRGGERDLKTKALMELNEPGVNPGSASHWLCKRR